MTAWQRFPRTSARASSPHLSPPQTALYAVPAFVTHLSPMSTPHVAEKAHTLPPASRVATDEELGYVLPSTDCAGYCSTDSMSLFVAACSNGSTEPLAQRAATEPIPHHRTAYEYTTDAAQVFWDRLRGKGRRPIGWLESAKNIMLSSCEFSDPFV